MNQIEIQWLFVCIGLTWGAFILGCGFAVQWLKYKKRMVVNIKIPATSNFWDFR